MNWEVYKKHFAVSWTMMVFLRKSTCPFELGAEQPPPFHGTQFLVERLTDRQSMVFFL